MPDDTGDASRWFAHIRPGHGAAVALLTVFVGLGACAPAGATSARPATGSVTSTGAAAAVAAAPQPLSPTIQAAKTTLSTALTQLQQQRYSQARASLSTLDTQLTDAHNLGMSPLRPARAIAVLNLEHQVLLSLLPPFNGLARSGVVSSLQHTIATALTHRTAMLNAIVALPADGAGGNFDDSMADTLPAYGAEVRRYTAALDQFQLTAAARNGLTADLAQITANRAQVRHRFGGGE